MNDPASCSRLSAEAEEQLIGSAPAAAAWLALEQPGPWGAKAFTQSHLDPEIGRSLETAATLAGVRPCLVRRPGRHADRHDAAPRTLLLAHTAPGRTWLLRGVVADPADLLGLDWAALAAGDVAKVSASLPGLTSSRQPQLLVCTNGSRDVCCAVEGRPLVAAAAAARPDQVWEVTHSSGHRFAPTTVLLPHGLLHGRVPVDGGARLLDDAAAGRLTLEGYRGRSTWPAPAQVAEHAVRVRAGEHDLDALDVVAHGDAWAVRHQDGRRWRVVVRVEETGVLRSESCGKAALPMRRYAVESTSPLA